MIHTITPSFRQDSPSPIPPTEKVQTKEHAAQVLALTYIEVFEEIYRQSLPASESEAGNLSRSPEVRKIHLPPLSEGVMGRFMNKKDESGKRENDQTFAYITFNAIELALKSEGLPKNRVEGKSLRERMHENLGTNT